MSVFLRAIRLLTIVVWVGGLVFFAFVLAPVAFHVLPTHAAGLVVGHALPVLDKIGFVCGLLFLVVTRSPRLGVQLAQWLLVVSMLVLTIYLHGGILPRMERDRAAAGGDITLAAPDDPARIDFNRLHTRSERLEGAVLLAGLAVVVLLAAEPAPSQP